MTRAKDKNDDDDMDGDEDEDEDEDGGEDEDGAGGDDDDLGHGFYGGNDDNLSEEQVLSSLVTCFSRARAVSLVRKVSSIAA